MQPRACGDGFRPHDHAPPVSTAAAGPPRNPAPSRRRQRKPAPPSRKSVRLMAKTWPIGDAQAKARQILMRRLGVLADEALSPED